MRLGAAAAAAAAAATLLGACSLPQQLRDVLFEPAPPPKPFVRALRREPYKPPVAVVVATEPPVLQTDWAQVYAELPRTAAGGVDWVDAIAKGELQLKPGLDEKAEEQPELDLDLELVPKDAPEFKVTYPHKIHTRLLMCTNCHTEIFQMEKGADPITMEKIFAGEYCGRCHGKVAFEPATGCPRCHTAMPQ